MSIYSVGTHTPSSLQTVPFWTEDIPRPADLPTASLPDWVDVAVIGSGYTGLHAARTVAKAGGSVVVLEQETIGWGASSRNGGMANPGLKESAANLFKHYGAARGRALWDWSLAAIDFLEATIRDEGIACDFGRYGQVVLAAKPSHLPQMRAEVRWHREMLGDSAPELLGPAELASEIGSPAFFGGIRDPRAAGLHPAKYVFGLAHAAARAGALLVERTRVRAVTGKPGSYLLTTDGGQMQAREVLLATNGYTTDLVPAARRGIFSGGSYIITTPPLTQEMQAALSPRGRMFYDSKHFLNYFRLTPDGRMLFGGRHNLSADLDLQTSATELRKRMVEVFPALVDVPITHSWTGRLGLTFDLMPHAGRVQDGPAPGLFYAYGYGGHGVAVAGYLGYAVGSLLAGRTVDNPLLGLPHPRYFFTPYERYYLPLVSAWFRFLDRIS